MQSVLHLDFEAHSSAATIYLKGPLSNAGALRAIGAVDGLPATVRALRLDLRGLLLFDVRALDALLDVVEHWAATRQALVRVARPAADGP